MEGKKDLIYVISVIVLVVLHAVGLGGFMADEWKAKFIELVPVHLAVITIILLVNHRPFNKSFFLFVTVAFITGFVAEWIGTATGILFGKYQYTGNLGPEVGDVPLLIGVLWAGLSYAVNSITSRIRIKSEALQIILPSCLMTGFDLLLEPFAIANELWAWEDGKIPLTNYNTWFGISILLSLLYHYIIKSDSNRVSLWFYGLQVIFFAVLLF